MNRSHSYSASQLFIYEGDQDFSAGWLYMHWATLGADCTPAIWGM